ncbi:MAG: methylmalonyl Co-A mutase-associated GTPase MeaB [Thaumarchaeota archaeon]|nr:MAG: methylmalonyl Co-A mutase-associated GTPase MeaB [Nitrososphaerota archaeon]
MGAVVTTAVLVEQVLEGKREAIAKAITLVENRGRGFENLLAALERKGGNAFVLGVTGPPGTGKSTLVDRLIERFRKRGLKVAVVAVDPTSPITGGALLGDRVRMLKHATDRGVYIRSMASRGWRGGLAGSTSEVVQILDAAGTELVIIETVGIGQSDIEIVSVAHAVLVTVTPGLGDDIQVSKAGLLEIGDIFVVNKSDLEGADFMLTALLSMVREQKRQRPVIKVSALKDEGIDKLVEAVDGFRQTLTTPRGREIKLKSLRGMIVEMAKNEVMEGLNEKLVGNLPDRLAREVYDGRLDLREAARRLSRR